MLKLIRILELVWLVIAIFSFIIGTYKLFTQPVIMDALFFYFLSGIAVFLFLWRRKQRKNIEKHNKEN